MRIVGTLDRFDRGIVHAILNCNKPRIRDYAIDFLVDTGSARTTVADFDVKKMGLDYDNLTSSKVPVSGTGGDVKAYPLKGCKISFELKSTTSVEHLKDVLALRHDYNTSIEEMKVMDQSSVLGMDVLKRYTIRFSQSKVILEYPTK